MALRYSFAYFQLEWSLVIGSPIDGGFLKLAHGLIRWVHNIGYAAIKPVLIREGVYSELCSGEEIDHGIAPCYGQEIRFAGYLPSPNLHADSVAQVESYVHNSSRCHQCMCVAGRYYP